MPPAPVSARPRVAAGRRDPVSPASQDHSGMVQNAAHKVSVCGEPGVVPVFDMSAGNFIPSLIGALARAARLDIPAVCKQLMTDMPVIGDPKAGEISRDGH